MSHPPETSLTSRELAGLKDRLGALRFLGEHGSTKSLPEDYIERIAALIDAWVRVRIAEAVRDEANWWHTYVALASMQEDVKDETRQRFASLTVEVERLKAENS